MIRGKRANLHFYEDYSGYSEKQLDKKLVELGIDIDKFSEYNGKMPIHEVKSIIIQNELFKLRNNE